MTYGRLDVFWPDGKIETFPLARSNVSVGRSTGSTIVLDTDTISRYHFSIAKDNDTVYLIDLESVNGTYLDGVKLVQGERYPLNGGEEIMAGQLRMTYHATDDSPTVPLHAVTEDTQRIEKQGATFRVELQLPHITVTPGAYTSVELMITNTARDATRYTIEVSGLPADWVRVNRPMLEVEPDEDALVLINIKPGRRSDTKPGSYTLNVRVRQQDRPENFVEAQVRVTIQAFSGFGMALAHYNVSTGEPFQLHIHNQGSAPLGLRITGSDPERRLTFRADQPEVTLAPGQHRAIRVEARPARPRIFGGIVEREAHILVQSTQLPGFTSAISGTVTDRAPLPTWAALMLGGLLLLALALVGFGLSGMLRAAQQPVIERLTVNNGESAVAQGEPIALNWDVSSARQIDVSVGGSVTLLDEASVATGYAEIPTDDLLGDVEIVFIARNGDQSATQRRTLNIFEPARIDAFDVIPQTVFRDVEQTLTLTWQVSGAVSVAISGPNTRIADDPSLDTGTMTLTLLPDGPFSITLSITDTRGVITALERQINVVPALCAPIQPDTPLYDIPDLRARIITVLQGTAQAQVSGIDQSRTWLRFRLADGTQLWGERARFDCQGTFDVERLRVIQVAAPTPTIAPPLTLLPQVTPTPTFTPTPRLAPTTAPTATTTGTG